jgi:trehalose 6-phosphate phosphatase
MPGPGRQRVVPAPLTTALQAALGALDPARSILAFDLDGTLAPLCQHPADARVPAATARRLDALARRWRVAVLTGRGVADARPRLGFEPAFVVGNHGAQRDGQPVDASLSAALDAWREHLHQQLGALATRGIAVEDKGLSLALHYRRAFDRCAARAWIAAAAHRLTDGVSISDGHCVVNISAAHAPDKGDALLALLHETGASNALVVGDDTNDEPAFAKAPGASVTVRVGRPIGPTAARHFLATQRDVDAVLAVVGRR